MGKSLDAIDKMIDVNAIVFQRCLDTIVRLVGQNVQPQLYGPEQDPAAMIGTIDAARALFEAVKREMPTVDPDALLEEYREEGELASRLAREQEGATQTQVRVSKLE